MSMFLVMAGFSVFLALMGIVLLYKRNKYTYFCAMSASEAISKYAIGEITKGNFESEMNYHEEMMISYEEFFKKFWLFGEEKMIKPEYREMIYNNEK